MKKIIQDLKKHGSIYVAIVGAGKMGTGLAAQLRHIDGMEIALMASRSLDNLYKAYELSGGDNEKSFRTSDLELANKALKSGKTVLSNENSLAWELDGIDVIVDCTGDTATGAELSYYGLLKGKNIVTLNVESDVLLGPLFMKMAKERNLCYTGTAGDEPGSILELYDFAKFLGFEVLAAGKGKNNPLDTSATPNGLAKKAKDKGLSPRMLTSFVDATNTMIELNAVANATGLIPDVSGCHGIHAQSHDLVDKLRLKTEGGILERYGILEYVHGIAPGVFVIIRTDSPVIDDEMTFLSMGEGPNYLLYRPYHLTNIETPISIAKAVLYKEATIEPTMGFVAHTTAVAKRNIKKGDKVQGIGSNATFGRLEEAKIAEQDNHVPIGLLTDRVIAKRDIEEGDYICFEDVELEEDLLMVRLFRELQNSKFDKEKD